MSLPKGYVGTHYLRLLEERMLDLKFRSYALMNIEMGDSVLDVGCGPGSDTIHLAQHVGATGEVMGLDYGPAMVAEADQRALKAGLSDVLKHRQGQTTPLLFADARFDACRRERLFQHLLRPEQALFEMARGTKPSGWVVVLDTDWGTLSIHTSLPEIERRLVQFSNEGCMHNSYAGRQLPQLLQHRVSGIFQWKSFRIRSRTMLFVLRSLCWIGVNKRLLLRGSWHRMN